MIDKDQPKEIPVVLDAETCSALEDGLREADGNSQRWTPEQVKADAKRMAIEWREKIAQEVSA